MSDPPTVAVTGGAGYVGSRVVAELREAHPDWAVRALDDFSAGDLRSVRGVDVERVDVRDRTALEDHLAGADVVVHLAAVSGVDACRERPDLAHEVNVGGTANVAWFCRKRGAALAVASSMAALGDPAGFPVTADLPREPVNWYGRTKLLTERVVGAYADGAVPAHVLLKANVYGEHTVAGRRVSRGSVVDLFVDRALSGDPLTVYDPGTQARNYVHVSDAARAYLRSVERLLAAREDGETGAETYEVAGDEDPSVREVAETVRAVAREEAGLDPEVRAVENPRPDETLVGRFPVDTTRTRRDLGWEPRTSLPASVRSRIRERC